MKFPILIKKGCIFVWYAKHWINIRLMARTHGGGIKGYYRFFMGWVRCILGYHSFTRVYKILYRSSHTQCSYCNKEKE